MKNHRIMENFPVLRHVTAAPAEEHHVVMTAQKRRRSSSSGDNVGFPEKRRPRKLFLTHDIKVVAPPERSTYDFGSESFHDHLGKIAKTTSWEKDKQEPDVGSCAVSNAPSENSQDTVPPPSMEEEEQRRYESEVLVKKHRLDYDTTMGGKEQLMSRLDNDVSHLDGRAITQFPLKKVCTSEHLQYIQSLPSLENQKKAIPSSRSLRRRRRMMRKRLSQSSDRTSIHQTSSGKVSSEDENCRKTPNIPEVVSVKCVAIRQRLPKFVSDFTADWKPRRLFTREQFAKDVILECEKKLPPDLLYSWSIDLDDCHPHDPNSYGLSARCPSEHLALLREKVTAFIRTSINRYNRKILLKDDKAITVEVSLPREDSGSLGMTLSQNYDRGAGVWVNSVNPETLFCRLLGAKAYEKGCLLMAINGVPVRNLRDARQFVRKSRVADGIESSSLTKVMLRLSRFASFEQSCDRSALTIQRPGGSL